MSSLFGVWELYGLKANPFDTGPLLVKGGIPIDTFFGRKEEVRTLESAFRSVGGSRTLVCGPSGVGKTTFVNYVRASAMEKGAFSPFREIGVGSDWTSRDFLINTLRAIYSTLELNPDKTGHKELIKRLQPLLDVTVDEGRGLSFSFAGVGVGYERGQTTTIPSLTIRMLQELFSETINGIRGAGYPETVLHYNNLELLEEEPEKLGTLLQNVRDFLQTPGVHFVFVGGLETASIFYSLPRIASILHGAPINLQPLSFEEVWSIIQKRFERLGIENTTPIQPFDKDAVGVLYELTAGNIRDIFNGLETCVTEKVSEVPTQFDKNTMQSVLYDAAEKRFKTGVSDPEIRILGALIQMKKREATPTELAKNTQSKVQNVSTYLKKLREKGMVCISKIDGRQRFYRPNSWVLWTLLKPDRTMQIQTKLR